MPKLNIREKQLWVSTIDKIAANCNCRQISHYLADASCLGKSDVVYHFTLADNTAEEDIFKLVISVGETEGSPKKDNLYCFDAGPIDVPDDLSNLFVPVTISSDEFYVLIEHIVVFTMCHITYNRISTGMYTNIEELTKDISNKRDLSSYIGASFEERIYASFKRNTKATVGENHGAN